MDALADRVELVELLGRYVDIADLKVEIDGDTAKIHAHVRAEHWVPDTLADGGPNRWLVAGFYDNEAVRTVDGWRLSRVKLTSTYQENPHLSGLAVTAGHGPRGAEGAGPAGG